MTEAEEFEFRHRFEQEQAQKPEPVKAEPTTYGSRLKKQTEAIAREAQNLTLGAVRGAGSIGNTILAAGDTVQQLRGLPTGGKSYAERKQGMDEALTTLGGDINSPAFKVGKLGGEVAGTAGAGGVLAQAGKGLGAAPEVINALRTNGFATGASRFSPSANLAIRSGAGAAAGGSQVGLADPENAGIGAAIGGALPGAAKLAGAAGSAVGEAAQSGARKLMGSALKGTVKMHAKGDVDTAVETLLDYGINPTKGGVEKIKGLVGELNDKISKAIEGSDAKIDKQKVLNALARSREKFGNQVDNVGDLAAVDKVGENFLASHPDEIPVQLAQKLKQGTYRVLRGKYGEAGSASTEAQKDLARGLKEGVAEAVPEVSGLNAAESRLLTTLKVAERRAMMDVNKNPLDLGSAIGIATGHPVGALASLANSTAWTKSMAARGLNAASRATPNINALAGPAAYRSLPRAGQRN